MSHRDVCEKNKPLRHRHALSFEELETRLAPSAYRVANLSSSASTIGSLPWAVAQANLDQSQSAAIITIDATLGGLNIPLTASLSFTNTSKTIQINGPTGGIFITGGGTSSNFSLMQMQFGTTVVLNDLVLRNGCASQGGAISSSGTLTLQSCGIINNTSRSGGVTSIPAYSGAVYNSGTLTAVNCLFSGNSASRSGDNAYYAGAGGAIVNSGTLTIATCTFSGNSAGGTTGSAGGAIANYDTMSITNSILTGNSTTDGGGAIINYQGTLTVAASTFTANSAPSGGSALLNYAGTVALTNSTFSGNTAATTGTGFGGAIYNYSGPLTITNCTIARNTASTAGGLYNDSGTVLLQNTIIILNTAAASPDVGGTNVSPLSSHNLLGASSGGLASTVNGNLVGIAYPLLSTLGTFGGIGQTIALLPGSPAIDAGNNTLAPTTVDQRGQSRTHNSTVDIGAVESQGFTLSLTGGNQSARTGAAFTLPLTVTVVANNPLEPVNLGKITFLAPTVGASATLSTANPITGGRASVSATANANPGTYNVAASLRGAAAAQFALTNNAAPGLGPLSQTRWTVDQAGYSATIAIIGGSGTFNNLLATGLPAGLTATLDGNTININGTPTQAGSFTTVSVSVQDSAGVTVQGTYTLTIHDALTLGPLSRTAWTANQPNYSGTLGILGGTGPFTIASATVTGLPAGLTYAVSGTTITISGTPTLAGTSTIDVQLLDTTGATGSGTVSLTVNTAPILSDWNGATSWTKGIAYSATISVSDGAGAYAKLSVTGLPLGLTASLSGSTITIAGKSTLAGTFNNIVVSVQDGSGAEATKTFSLTINVGPALGALDPPAWTVDQPDYSGTINITGGTGAYTILAVSGLPTGLTVSLTGTTITVAGTPTLMGLFSNIVVSVQDSNGAKVQRNVRMTVNAGPTLGPLSRTAWTATQAGYAGTIAISGGTAPFAIDALTGLPAGLGYAVSGATVKITGTPSTAGTGAIGVIVKDATGATVQGSYTLTINAAPALSALSKTTWTVNKSYAGDINITGGTPAHSKLSVIGLPVGLSAVLAGTTVKITGIPTQTGVFNNVTVALQDGVRTKIKATYSLTIAVASTLGALNRTAWTLAQPNFVGTIAIASGTAPFTIASATGLPTGLTANLSGRTITISGTPTQAGSFTAVSLLVQDAAGVRAKATYGISIRVLPTLGNLTVSTWKVNQVSFPGTIAITGGLGPFVITNSTGLPAGLTASIVGYAVKFIGKPTQSGPFILSLEVQDSTGAAVAKDFTLTIDP